MLKQNVLRRKQDFSSIYNKGKSLGDQYVVLFYRPNGLGYNRKAFLASKKVGKSVKRNRARRLMKESFRQIEGNLLPGYDLILIARTTINGVKCQAVRRSVFSALSRAKLTSGGSGGGPKKEGSGRSFCKEEVQRTGKAVNKEHKKRQ